MTAAGQPRSRWYDALAVRLALLLAAGVLVALFVVGVLVNVAVTRNVEELIGQQTAARIELAADSLVDLYRARGSFGDLQRALTRLTSATAGHAEVYDASGELVASAGRPIPPFAGTQTIEATLTDGGDTIGTLRVEVPTRDQERPFLRAFNATLLLGGALAVVAILGLALAVSDRLTRPLRDLSRAARRLGAGDFSVRAAGGRDRESTELAGAFNEMAARLQRSESLRRRAASDVAHDLATPATVLESQLQAMADGVLPLDRDQLEAARRAAAALSAVISDLGELSAAEAAALQRRPERFDLGDAVREAAAALEGLYRERDVRLELPPPGAAGEARPALVVAADRHQVERALRNVLANAAQYTPRGRAVRVELAASHGLAEVRIVDEGPGIAPEHLPHLFERFYRVDASRGSPGGTGLGLTIARELLAANGGRIGVERTGPEGTVFLVSVQAA